MRKEKVKKIFSKSDFRNLVLVRSNKTRRQYITEFQTETDQFINSIYECYRLFIARTQKWKNSNRNWFVEAYLHNAIDKLAISVNLFIQGYFVSSGNLARQFCESCCMAILLSTKKIKYYDKFKAHFDSRNTKKIKTNESCFLVEKNRKKIGISKKGWKSFQRLRKLYHRLSHPSVFSLATIVDFSRGIGCRKFGAHFDNGKTSEYKKEINFRIEATNYLKDIIEGISNEVEKE